MTGWTAQRVYDILKPNAMDLAEIGPKLTVRVQTDVYVSTASTGVSEVGGVYSNYQATIYLQAKSGTTFTAYPDNVIAHEYGHAWSLYHLYMDKQGDWSSYLAARGLTGDPRVGSTYNWGKDEMIADDYRMLFGTPAAVSQGGYINPDVPDPRTVPGLSSFLQNNWTTP